MKHLSDQRQRCLFYVIAIGACLGHALGLIDLQMGSKVSNGEHVFAMSFSP